MKEVNSKMVIEISSDTLQLFLIEEFLKNIFQKYALSNRMFIKVLICVNEAVVNSITHGNEYDLNKRVTVTSEYKDQTLFFRIEDQGEGFDFNHIPDPTTRENILKETGRGIYLLQHMAEGIDFKENGSVIEFSICINE